MGSAIQRRDIKVFHVGSTNRKGGIRWYYASDAPVGGFSVVESLFGTWEARTLPYL